MLTAGTRLLQKSYLWLLVTWETHIQSKWLSCESFQETMFKPNGKPSQTYKEPGQTLYIVHTYLTETLFKPNGDSIQAYLTLLKVHKRENFSTPILNFVLFQSQLCLNIKVS
jgi:hypothetical protein